MEETNRTAPRLRKYHVDMSRTVQEYRTFEIEAESIADAESKAWLSAESDGDGGWKQLEVTYESVDCVSEARTN